jgi:hypothetical protein
MSTRAGNRPPKSGGIVGLLSFVLVLGVLIISVAIPVLFNRATGAEDKVKLVVAKWEDANRQLAEARAENATLIADAKKYDGVRIAMKVTTPDEVVAVVETMSSENERLRSEVAQQKLAIENSRASSPELTAMEMASLKARLYAETRRANEASSREWKLISQRDAQSWTSPGACPTCPACPKTQVPPLTATAQATPSTVYYCPPVQCIIPSAAPTALHQ